MPTAETDSISSTVLSTHDHQIDDIYGDILANPIPSPPIQTSELGETSHFLDLQYAVSFAAFLELSDNDLRQSNLSMSNLGSLSTDLPFDDEPESEKTGPKLEKLSARSRYVVWPYSRVGCFARRLLGGSNPRSLLCCEMASSAP